LEPDAVIQTVNKYFDLNFLHFNCYPFKRNPLKKIYKVIQESNNSDCSLFYGATLHQENFYDFGYFAFVYNKKNR
jgi:hypothetical protein